MNDAKKLLGKALCDALKAEDFSFAKGGGFHVKDHGYFTVARARKITGIAATARPVKAIATHGAPGEYNAFCALVLGSSRGAL